jgi:membrane-associated phospholipid phosphatase
MKAPRRDRRLPNAADVMLAEPHQALAWSAALAAVGVVVCLLVWSTATLSVVQWVDDRFLSLMEDVRVAPLTAVAKALAFLGGVWCTWIVRAGVVAILVRRRHWVHLAAFALAVVSSEMLIGTLKVLYDRPRPPDGLIGTTSSSFPSGHAVAGAVTAVGLVVALLPPGHTRWVWERHAALYASSMALSRAYLGAHWLSDVVAGALLGSALAVGWPAVLVIRRIRHEYGATHGERSADPP